MPVIINGSTGISGVDGSAGTPAFQGSDANTGIRFGTDIVSLVTGGSDRLYIDSSGRLGVGTSSPSNTLHVVGTGRFINGSNPLIISTDSGDPFVYTESAAGLKLGANSSVRLTIASSGNIGIGTTSPESLVHINGDATAFRITRGSSIGFVYCTGTLTSSPFRVQANDGPLDLYSGASQPITFSAATSEKARIDSSGRLLVGVTTGTMDLQIKSAGGLQASDGTSEIVLRYNMYWDGAANRYIQAANKASSLVCDNTGSFIFYNTNTASTSAGSTVSGLSQRWKIDNFGSLVGSTGCAFVAPYINDNTTANAANVNVDTSGFLRRSTSSIKYKNNVNDATHGLMELMQLRPVTYTSKAETDGSTVFGGLIAEEVDAVGLSEFVQYAEDGSPDALAYGNMVSLCIKAIQEQQVVIEELQAKIAAIEAS